MPERARRLKARTAARRTAYRRGYDRRWRRASQAFLDCHPFCRHCGQEATCVDHVIPHRGNPEKFWDERNWQPLCKPCHDRKTAAGQ